MRRFALVLVLLALLTPLCRAEESPAAIPGLDKLWEAAEDYGVAEGTGLERGLGNLFLDAAEQAGQLWKRSLRVGVELLGIALLCGLAESAFETTSAVSAAKMTGALAITALSVNNMEAMIGLGRETIGKMDAFSGVLLPVMAALTAATGRATLAAAHQGATVLFVQVLIGLIDRLLIPLVYAHVAACCAWAAVGNEGLKKLSALLKGAVQMILTGLLLAFVSYLTATRAVAGSADAAAVKAAKIAINRTLPVVGGILSDAAEAILAGAGALRGTVGAAGALVVLAICLGPFLQLAFHYLTFKLAAALTAAVADARLSGLLDSIGAAFGLVLGMTGACALLLLISLVCAVSAVLS